MSTPLIKSSGLLGMLQRNSTLDALIIPGKSVLRSAGLRLPPEIRPIASPYHARAMIVIGEVPQKHMSAVMDMYNKVSLPKAVMTVSASHMEHMLLTLVASKAASQQEFDADVRLFRNSWLGLSDESEQLGHDHKSAPQDMVATHEGHGDHHQSHGMVVKETDHSMHDNHAGDHAHQGHDMSGMEEHGSMDHSMHGEGGMMSMLEMTKDTPRSDDGLAMESADVTFGPFHYGLPPGLLIILTLDGDTVERARIESTPIALRYAVTDIKLTRLLDGLNRLIQFLELCGARALADSAERLYWQARDDQASHDQVLAGAQRFSRKIRKSWILKLRLKDLAPIKMNGDSHNVWDRLIYSTAVVQELADGLTRKNNQPPIRSAVWSDKEQIPLIETAIAGYEVGDALIAVASFDLVQPGAMK
jgi:hypothetical protein